ncbi:MAG: hypothetical protein JXB23_12630 [Candidatus Aminicenantes bacterium]|nr:hypothetical protein [Candidatus Aminicenantes bacterium]
MKISKFLVLSTVTITFFVGCQHFRMEVYPDLRMESIPGSYSGPCRDSLENLLADIWATGFFNNNQFSREEILNNRYGIFNTGSSVSRVTSGRACFIKEKEGSDMVMLNRRLFSHLQRDDTGRVGVKMKDRNLSATLVHELFHDFWHNTIDRQKRALFATEMEILYKDIIMAKSEEEKIQFLKKIGYRNPKENDFRPFSELQCVKKNYTNEKFFGTELFSIIADRTFSRKIIIPKQLRIFYSGIIADEILERSSPQ